MSQGRLAFTIRYAPLNPIRCQWRLCRNPAYNNDHVSLNNWCRLPLREIRKPRLQGAMDKSVAEDGMRNPPVFYALEEGIFLSFGGTRLRAAQKCGMPVIKALIVDYTGEFSKYPKVTPSNWTTFFKDVPEVFEFTDYGIDTHYSLERMRRHKFDPAGLAWLEGDRPDWIEEEMSWLTEAEGYE